MANRLLAAFQVLSQSTAGYQKVFGKHFPRLEKIVTRLGIQNCSAI